jgi:glycosyltransferase involved in cell wall biosynthesis
MFHSIILANFNGAAYLGDAIESVLAQRDVQFELLIVDDASTDNSQALAENYARKHPRIIRLLRHACNRGQGAGFNTGATQATGQVVSFIDSDDLWFPEKLKAVQSVFEDHPDTALFHHNLLFLRDGAVGRELVVDMMALGDLLIRWKKTKCELNELPRFAPTSGLSLPRAVLQKILPCPEVRFCADMHLTFGALPFGPVRASYEPLGAYRVHSGNLYFGNAKLQLWQFFRENFAEQLAKVHEAHGVAKLPEFLLPTFANNSTRRPLANRLLDLSPRKILRRFGF